MASVNESMNAFAKRTVQIGSIKVCYPAFVTLICGLIISILIGVGGNIWLGILTLGVFLVTTYNVNCVVVGNCTTWAWILMCIYIFYVLANVMIMTTLGKIKNNLGNIGNIGSVKSSRR